MSTSTRARASLLASARKLLEAAHGPQTARLAVLVTAGPLTLVNEEPTPDPSPAPGRLTRELRSVLEALDTTPRNAKEIARRLQRPYNSYLRSQLKELVRLGRAVGPKGGGYRLA